MSVKAIILKAAAGPEALLVREAELSPPGAGELRMRQTAIGVNHQDIYVRSGMYRTLSLPGITDIEAIGVVEAVGGGVTGYAPSDRIDYVSGAYGLCGDAQARHCAPPHGVTPVVSFGWQDSSPVDRFSDAEARSVAR